MSLNARVRQIHRWLSLAFTLAVIAMEAILPSRSGRTSHREPSER